MIKDLLQVIIQTIVCQSHGCSVRRHGVITEIEGQVGNVNLPDFDRLYNGGYETHYLLNDYAQLLNQRFPAGRLALNPM